MAGNPTPVFRDDQNVSKASARSHLPHRVGSVSDVRATNFAGVYRIYVSENRRNYDFIPSDATSPDDGFTVIVGPNGERWKHVDIDGSGGGAFDVVVPNIAARAAYDDEKEGFLVLVESDSGHSNDPWGYAKDSDASGDWTAGFPIRGPAVSDGDKGDIVVSGSGATWTIDEAALGKVSAEESVASAGTLNLTSTKARVLLTGTTATTTITMGNNQRRRLRVQDGWMCNVPGVLVRWLPQGSIVVFESDGSGNVRVVSRHLPFGATPHIEASALRVSPHRPIFVADFASKPYLDDGIYYSNTSGARLYQDGTGTLRSAGVGEPAFETDYTTGYSGLQYYGQFTNQCLRGSKLGTSPWIGIGLTVDENVMTVKGFTLSKLVETATNGEHYRDQTITSVNTDNPNTVSLVIMPGERRYFLIRAFASPTTSISYRVVFDAQTGTFTDNIAAGGATATYRAKYLGSGIWRIWMTVLLGGTNTSIIYRMQVRNDSNAASYLGETNKGIYVGYAGLVAGSKPGPIILTDASTVTRTGDELYRDLAASEVNADGMTLYAEAMWDHGQETGTADTMAALGKSTAVLGEDVYLSREVSSLGLLFNTSPTNMQSTYVMTTYMARIAARIKANDARASVNGNLGNHDTDCVMPADINRLTMGGAPHRLSGTLATGGLLGRVSLYGRALNDASLNTLTS